MPCISAVYACAVPTNPASHLKYITICNTKCHRSEPSAGLREVIAVTSYYDSYYCLANVFFHKSAYQIKYQK